MPDRTYYSQWRQSTNRVLTDYLTARVNRALDQAGSGLEAAGVNPGPVEQFHYSAKDSTTPVVYDTQGWAGKTWGQKTLSELKLEPGRVQLQVSGPSWLCGRESASTDTYTVEQGTRRAGLLSLKKLPAQIYAHTFEDRTRGMSIRQESAFVGGELRFSERIWAGTWSGAVRAAVSVAGVTALAAGAVVGAQFGLGGALLGAPLAFGALATAFRCKIPGLGTTKEFLKDFPMETLAFRDRTTWD